MVIDLINHRWCRILFCSICTFTQQLPFPWVRCACMVCFWAHDVLKSPPSPPSLPSLPPLPPSLPLSLPSLSPPSLPSLCPLPPSLPPSVRQSTGLLAPASAGLMRWRRAIHWTAQTWNPRTTEPLPSCQQLLVPPPHRGKPHLH